MNALIFFAAIVAVALIGWAFAELKSKACTYHNDQDINDVVKSISTKGFDAI